MMQPTEPRSMGDWTIRLGEVLAAITGSHPAIRQVPLDPGQIPEPLLWWRGFGVAPICIGVTQPDAASLLGMRERELPGETTDPVRASFSDILTRSWGRGAITAENPPNLANCELYRAEFATGVTVHFLVANAPAPREDSNLDMLMDIELPITLRFGSTQMALREIVGLSAGSVVEFDRAVDDPVEVMVNGHVVARGEAVVVQGSYGVRVLEISSRRERLLTSSLSASQDRPGLGGEQIR